MKTKLHATLIPLALSVCSGALAAQSTWKGGEGVWHDEANWKPWGIPNVADGNSVLIASGYVNYVPGGWDPGGDWVVNGEVTLTGGKFEQTGGDAWMHIGNREGYTGVVAVSGNAVFDMGTSGQNRFGLADRTSSGSLNVSGNGAALSENLLTLHNGFVTLRDEATFESGSLSMENGMFDAGDDTVAEFFGNISVLGGYSTLSVSGGASVTGMAVTVTGGTVQLTDDAYLGCTTFDVSYAGTVVRLNGGTLDCRGGLDPVIKDCRFIMTGGEFYTGGKTLTLGGTTPWDEPPVLRGGLIDTGTGEIKVLQSCTLDGTDVYAKLLSMGDEVAPRAFILTETDDGAVVVSVPPLPTLVTVQ